MSVEENIETVYRDIDVFNKREFNNRETDLLSEIYADNYKYHLPGLEVKGVKEFVPNV